MNKNDLIETVLDLKRGCGWRAPGAIYLRSDESDGFNCVRVPIPLDVCNVCGEGVKPSRGFTWINPVKLFSASSGADTIADGCNACYGFPQETKCATCRGSGEMERLQECGSGICSICPFGGQSSPRGGLVWVGDKFYSPKEFIEEAQTQGISRRISNIPTDFAIGKTWIYAAHRKATKKKCEEAEPHTDDCVCEGTGGIDQAAIFFAFCPSKIEYITKGTETIKELEAMRNRGVTPVKVIRIDKNGNQIEGTGGVSDE